jgi:DNA repair exonuclease SbcCD ATPase subunit
VGVTQGDGAVLGKRIGQDNDETQELNASLAAGETLRSAANPAQAGAKHDEEKLSVFWRVFGGTILSIVALVAITLYNNISGNISELRNELNREREARAGLAKKEDLDTRLKSQWERIRLVEGYKAEIEGIKERSAANGIALEAVKKEAAGLDVLKERVAALEAVRKEIAGLELVRERLTSLTADTKSAREEVAKLHQEVEKNKTYDLERKTFRDMQAKQVEETLKELQKGLQDCREKLARLEGAQPVGPPAPKGPRTADASENKKD